MSKTSVLHCLKIIFLSVFLCQCTQKIDPKQSQQQQQQKKEVKNLILEDLTKDKALSSWLTEVAKDIKPLKAWEDNDGWVAYFQGNHALAFEHFSKQITRFLPIQATNDAELIVERNHTLIGLVRSALSLSETYFHLHTLTADIFEDWQVIEEQRENRTLNVDQIAWLKSRFSENTFKFDSKNPHFENTAQITSFIEMSEILNGIKYDQNIILDDATFRKLLTFLQEKKSGLSISMKDQNQKVHHFQDPLVHHFYRIAFAVVALQTSQIALALVNDSANTNALRLDEIEAFNEVGQRDLAISRLKSLQTQNLQITQASMDQLILSEILTVQDLPFKQTSMLISLQYQQAIDLINQGQVAQAQSLDQEAKVLLDGLKTSTAQAHLSAKLQLAKATAYQERFKQILNLAQQGKTNFDVNRLSYLPKIENPQSEWQENQLIFPQIRQPLLKIYQEKIGNDPQIVQFDLPERLINLQQRAYASMMLVQNQLVWALKSFEASEERGLELGGKNTLNALLQNAIVNLYTQRLRVASKYLNRIRPNLPSIAWALDMLSDLLTHQAQKDQGGVNAGQ
jgi:hypothetical protein